MTVYVDNFRVPARVGRITARWSHLTADTEAELHAFARRLGLQRAWFQEKCKTRCGREGWPCPHWHYDVTDAKRMNAIGLGAKAITLREMGDLIGARRARQIVECDGLCVYSADIGVPGYGVAYPHPGCPVHDPEQVCACGHPDRCLSPTHGQVTLPEALRIPHHQGGDR